MDLHHVRRGQGEPLVLLHGIGDTHRAWTRVLDRLALERDCWALDLPGFGASPPLPDAWTPSPAGLAAAVVLWMRRHGVERFHVAGNSLGGAAALEIARAGRASSVCVISPVGFESRPEAAFSHASLLLTRAVAGALSPRMMRLPGARRLVSLQMMHRGHTLHPDEHRAVVEHVARAPGFHSTLPHTVAHRFAGPLPDVPVTVAWGEHDRLLLHGPQSRRAREALPQARHVTLRGCGHVPTWDDPEQVARVLLEASGVG